MKFTCTTTAVAVGLLAVMQAEESHALRLRSLGAGAMYSGPGASQTIPPITTEGKNLLVGKSRFMVRGMCFAKDKDVDLLASENADVMLSKWAPELVKLNVNTIRVYQIDPTADHSASMNILAENGIYVVVNCFNSKVSVETQAPAASVTLFERLHACIDNFAQFNNVMAIEVGNEVNFPGQVLGNLETAFPNMDKDLLYYQANAIQRGGAIAQRGLIMEAKSYMKQKGYRIIPTTVAVQDAFPFQGMDPNMGWNDEAINLLTCGEDNERVDILGYNCFAYMNGNLAAYSSRQQFLGNLPIPLYLSEAETFEAPDVGGRDWKIVSELSDPNSQYKYYEWLSGQNAYQMWGMDGGSGIFSDDNMTPENGGNPDQLETQNGLAAKMQTPMASTPTNSNPTCSPQKHLGELGNPPVLATLQNLHASSIAYGVFPQGLVSNGDTQVVIQTPFDSTRSQMFFLGMANAPGQASTIISNLVPQVDLKITLDSTKQYYVFAGVQVNGGWQVACTYDGAALQNGATIQAQWVPNMGNCPIQP